MGVNLLLVETFGNNTEFSKNPQSNEKTPLKKLGTRVINCKHTTKPLTSMLRGSFNIFQTIFIIDIFVAN